MTEQFPPGLSHGTRNPVLLRHVLTKLTGAYSLQQWLTVFLDWCLLYLLSTSILACHFSKYHPFFLSFYWWLCFRLVIVYLEVMLSQYSAFIDIFVSDRTYEIHCLRVPFLMVCFLPGSEILLFLLTQPLSELWTALDLGYLLAVCPHFQGTSSVAPFTLVDISVSLNRNFTGLSSYSSRTSWSIPSQSFLSIV